MHSFLVPVAADLYAKGSATIPIKEGYAFTDIHETFKIVLHGSTGFDILRIFNVSATNREGVLDNINIDIVSDAYTQRQFVNTLMDAITKAENSNLIKIKEWVREEFISFIISQLSDVNLFSDIDDRDIRETTVELAIRDASKDMLKKMIMKSEEQQKGLEVLITQIPATTIALYKSTNRNNEYKFHFLPIATNDSITFVFDVHIENIQVSSENKKQNITAIVSNDDSRGDNIGNIANISSLHRRIAVVIQMGVNKKNNDTALPFVHHNGTIKLVSNDAMSDDEGDSVSPLRRHHTGHHDRHHEGHHDRHHEEDESVSVMTRENMHRYEDESVSVMMRETRHRDEDESVSLGQREDVMTTDYPSVTGTFSTLSNTRSSVYESQSSGTFSTISNTRSSALETRTMVSGSFSNISDTLTPDSSRKSESGTQVSGSWVSGSDTVVSETSIHLKIQETSNGK